ncbi:Asp-tRNA(Asn)/Glu-tRNA(Gln) amidotransferase subunit GatA [Peptoniphilus sp. KCTC 25270]|uniref:Asp-tRNA(Asn)/Glu-tRNA(Gln) amidotransferase subunit GatA n=1 Tax=Peptoniphilus sp. KCTC 25270 TaxID=2897414 RepID=UPI001E3FAC78|nr:Asp-tRNA(Asn)/Glu-tRNA(Gln) amidotransferase subunit GatA [Peptoniphilus sp. KCTC 25270]MCD1147215.1 Asp-tRNA(Asn)/Glu-tRNA(Gln) amidotransferase subunit GatA [Peptoniphilus sp. KCTC 25270]
MSCLEWGAVKTHQRFIKGEVSAKEIVEAYISEIEAHEKDFNAFITKTFDMAREKAEELDQKREKGEPLGKLAGVVVSIKDNIAVKDVLMTCASKMLENFVAPYNATLTETILKEDGIIIGKTNLDEFAMGGDTKTSYYGITKNPMNVETVAGGSSGGSAASVAGNFSAIGIGTDTGGSVRQPASFCGVVGMKPTYGSISRYGIASMANTFDQPGVHGKNVEDVLYTLELLQGQDIKDATSLGNEFLTKEAVEKAKPVEELRIAVPDIMKDFDVEDEVQEAFDSLLERLMAKGAKVEYVPMPYLRGTIEVYHILVNGEIAPNMSRFDGIRYGHRAENYENLDELYIRTRSEGFGDEVKRRIMIGTHILSMELSKEYYEKAMEMRSKMIEEFDNVYKDFDVVMVPTAPVLAFDVERELTRTELYMADIFTAPVNIIGGCGISVPVAGAHLPVGIQVIGARFHDNQIIRTAFDIEKEAKHVL